KGAGAGGESLSRMVRVAAGRANDTGPRQRRGVQQRRDGVGPGVGGDEVRLAVAVEVADGDRDGGGPGGGVDLGGEGGGGAGQVRDAGDLEGEGQVRAVRTAGGQRRAADGRRRLGRGGA